MSKLAIDHDARSLTTSATKTLKPLFVVGGLYSLSNGVAWIMRDLAAALGRAGSPVDVFGADCYGRGEASVGHIFEAPSRWHTAKGLWLGGLSISPGLKHSIYAAVPQADIVHNHSVWMLPNSYSSRAAEKFGKPVVVTAHGTLEPWAVQNSGWKKRLVGRWFQNHELHQASCILVNNTTEIAGIRQYGLKNPIAVIPNGVHLPDFDPPASPERFLAKFPETRGKRLALFMARIHEKKGLGHLVPAFAEVSRANPDWHLVIAGPRWGRPDSHSRSDRSWPDRRSSDLHRPAARGAESLRPFRRPGLRPALVLRGIQHVDPGSSGLPPAVLLTPGCNFPEAISAGAALSVEPETGSCTEGLRQLLASSETQLQAMGQRGRALVESRYQWDAVAQETLQLYQWLINGGPSPQFVVT